jgi:hypothetical protein
MKTIYLERQDDDSFAVYVGGDDDHAGIHDRIFSFDKTFTLEEARLEAQDYARKLAVLLGGADIMELAYDR